jgi:hypothetical protein
MLSEIEQSSDIAVYIGVMGAAAVAYLVLVLLDLRSRRSHGKRP